MKNLLLIYFMIVTTTMGNHYSQGVNHMAEQNMSAKEAVLSPSDTDEKLNQLLSVEENSKVVYQEGFISQPVPDAVFERIDGLSFKKDCTVPLDELRYLQVLYVDFDGAAQSGELICNKAIATDLLVIFFELYQAGYPIDKIRLVDEYQADDTISITDNNTSCFNFRVVDGTTSLSKHALGLAIDINPFFNPYVTYPNGGIRISPIGSEPYADRSADFPHKIDKDDLAFKLFTEHGFTWGGDWKTLKDYQHFQKAIK